ncbi:protein of unknown function [Vibrio tapetis subsp. tapetis]|uniref:Uncharacterized protein n=1 Tax=Vibrio tapetis subsp. tapetis TaxID=1671868 RepID=A0A2N8ZGK6_9VIBR|nr:protein of unknown function [Vibrio tapetis subsp. tapetis]
MLESSFLALYIFVTGQDYAIEKTECKSVSLLRDGKLTL